MGKKLDQPGFTLWSAIIGVTGVIIGAALGYFGTQASAQAQIETAKINIYGPIYTTQTAEARITPPSQIIATDTIDTLLLEDTPQEVFSFQGIDEQQDGKAYLRILYTLNQQPMYKLIYDLPTTDQYGWAGLAFKFNEVIDVSEYKSLDFTIRFDSANQSIDLVLVDRANIKNFIPIISPSKDPINMSFPLANFTDIDLTALKEINFYTTTDANTGYHTLFISNVRFVR